MSRRVGRFDFEVIQMTASDSLPFNPELVLCLTRGGRQTRDGFPVVSGTLMSAQEIDDYVLQLKSDLDAVSKTSKAALKRAQERTKTLVASRRADRPG